MTTRPSQSTETDEGEEPECTGKELYEEECRLHAQLNELLRLRRLAGGSDGAATSAADAISDLKRQYLLLGRRLQEMRAEYRRLQRTASSAVQAAALGRLEASLAAGSTCLLLDGGVLHRHLKRGPESGWRLQRCHARVYLEPETPNNPWGLKKPCRDQFDGLDSVPPDVDSAAVVWADAPELFVAQARARAEAEETRKEVAWTHEYPEDGGHTHATVRVPALLVTGE